MRDLLIKGLDDTMQFLTCLNAPIVLAGDPKPKSDYLF